MVVVEAPAAAPPLTLPTEVVPLRKAASDGAGAAMPPLVRPCMRLAWRLTVRWAARDALRENDRLPCRTKRSTSKVMDRKILYAYA